MSIYNAVVSRIVFLSISGYPSMSTELF